MGIETTELFKRKPFPRWFKNHQIFKEVKTINKVFPGLGLPNTEEEVEIGASTAKEAAADLVKKINDRCQKRIQGLEKFAGGKVLSAKRKEKQQKCIDLLKAVSDQLTNKSDEVIKKENRLALKLQSDVQSSLDKKPAFRKNESLFRVYNKLNEMLGEGKFATMPALDNTPAFKTFSAKNIPGKKFKIVFSSDGADGIWDVSTMSMRGIKSCQSWDTGQFKQCTIGSAIDPFVGIIYLTSGEKYNDYGTKMIRRCIVRFVVEKDSKTPMIMLDHMYPDLDQDVLATFTHFIKEKTKLEVKYAPNAHNEINKVYMPLTTVRAKIEDYGANQWGEGGIKAYQDVQIPSLKSESKDKHAKLYEKNTNKKASKFAKKFIKAFSQTLETVSEKENIPETVKPVIDKLISKPKRANTDNKYLINELAKILANEFVSSLDKNNFTNSDVYLRRLYMNYFNMKDSVIEKIKNKVAKDVSGKLGLKKKIAPQKFVETLNFLMPEIDAVMKKHLKELVENRKKYKAVPLP